MIDFSASGFDWDDGNVRKCQTHGLSIPDIESVLLGQPLVAPDVKHSWSEQRFIAIGKTAQGRFAFVVFTLRAGLVRPLSARYMHATEVARYDTQGP